MKSLVSDSARGKIEFRPWKAFTPWALVTWLLGFPIIFLLPFAMRFWIRAMAISPSGTLVVAGLVIGISAFIASIVWMVRSSLKIRANRKAGGSDRMRHMWFWATMVASLHLLIVPTAICLALRSAVGDSPSEWRRNEDKLVVLMENKIWGRER